MQMLDKGGVDILQDHNREADISNPKGYYEYDPVMSLYKDNSWMHKGQNKAIKIVAPLLKSIDTKYRYKIIFMKRDLNEVIQSQQKMLGKTQDVFPVKIYNEFQKLLSNVAIWGKKEPGVEILYIDYKQILEKPEEMAKKVQEFIGKDLDVEAMASCVDTSLYRNRKESIT